MRLQQGWLTRDSNSRLGHFRKTVIDENGKESRKPVARRLGPADMDEREALEALRRLIVEETGIMSDGSVTLEGFTKSRWIPTREGDWRDSSRETIAYKLAPIYERFNGVALNKIDSVMLQSFLNQLAKTRAGSTVKMTRAYLKSIFNEAVEQDYIRKNPARRLRVPKQLKPVAHPFLSMEEIAALLKAASPLGIQTRDFALLRLMLSVALRPGEVFALRWRHLDLTADKATVTLEQTLYRGVLRNFTKTTVEGEAPAVSLLPEMAAGALRDWYAVTAATYFERNPNAVKFDDNAFVFPNSDGGFIHPGNYLSRILQPLAKQAKVKTKVTYQVLRRTCATHMQDMGSLKDIQTVLRHKQAQTTANIYVQSFDKSVRETVERAANKMFAPAKAQA